jgi:branched-chain amino acid transport system substrate-binding protein
MKYLLGMCALLFNTLCLAVEPVYVGFDGAYGLLNSTSAQSIEKGIRIAFEEINANGGVLDGRPLALLTADNRSVPARGIANLKKFAQQPDLVAVVGGRFSPVILEQIPIAHELNMILLDAWGSADGITKHNHKPSYTFRLSLRDALAAPVMLQHAQSKGAKTVGLLLPNTGWGRSNYDAALTFFEQSQTLSALPYVWYNWGERDMLKHYQALLSKGADVLLLVANDIEASLLIRQLTDAPDIQRIPIVSHWGITGGKFVANSGDTLFDLDFSVVQTFSFFNTDNAVSKRVLKLADQMFGLQRIEDIKSPVGLAHAYDLMHILAQAINLAGTTERAKIRDALEQVKDYQGLTAYYPQPFTAENHDALRLEQVFMARYRRDGAIIPIE